MADKLSVNPLREGLASRAMPEPCSVVIFGATGDLTIESSSRLCTTWPLTAICRLG